MDHIRELQGRLFSIVLAFIVVAGAAYPFFGKIADVLLAPLNKNQELVYLTPGGAFSFIIKVCVYIGIVGALPVIIFHIYRFVMPAVKQVHLRTVLYYTIASMVLAICGIVFAYYVSLPASLYFLTGFDLYHINPMLTIDSYFSFVMTYMLAGALLFQLPIVMMIINSATPLTPKKLMNYQRHMIVGSFVVAAVISPTPDALNQTLLAAPMVVMYQIGVILIWSMNRKRAKSLKKTREVRAIEAKIVKRQRTYEDYLATDPAMPLVTMTPKHDAPVSIIPMGIGSYGEPEPAPVSILPQATTMTASPKPKPATHVQTMDGVRRGARPTVVAPVTRPAPQPAAPVRPPAPTPRPRRPDLDSYILQRRDNVSPFAQATGRSIDGVIIPRRA